MALQKELTDETTGATYPEAYYKIKEISFDKNRIRVDVRVYVSKENSDKASIDRHIIYFDESDPNTSLTDSYTRLKSLPMFAEATDA